MARHLLSLSSVACVCWLGACSTTTTLADFGDPGTSQSSGGNSGTTTTSSGGRIGAAGNSGLGGVGATSAVNAGMGAIGTVGGSGSAGSGTSGGGSGAVSAESGGSGATSANTGGTGAVISSTGGRGGAGGLANLGGATATGGAAVVGLPAKLACADQQVPESSVIAPTSTVTSKDRQTLSCGIGSSPEVLYDWLVPRTNYYQISTAGSTFDTVLGARSATCDGTELACSDDANGTPQSELVRRFEAGQRIVLVADGKAGDAGNLNLSIAPVTCPALDLSGQALPLSTALTTVGGTNSQGGKCGGAGRLERTVRWLPPSDGLYRFSVSSETFDPALHVENGARCGGELLGCNATPTGSPAQVTRRLKASQPVSLIVDSTRAEGAFTLGVQRLTATCPAKADTDLPGAEEEAVTLSSTAAPDVLSGSCVPAGGLVDYKVQGYPDLSYSFPVSLCDTCRQMLQFHGTGSFAVYLLKGSDCSGPESSCVVATASSAGTDWTANLSFTKANNGNYVLVVESLENYAVKFWVTMSMIA